MVRPETALLEFQLEKTQGMVEALQLVGFGGRPRSYNESSLPPTYYSLLFHCVYLVKRGITSKEETLIAAARNLFAALQEEDLQEVVYLLSGEECLHINDQHFQAPLYLSMRGSLLNRTQHDLRDFLRDAHVWSSFMPSIFKQTAGLIILFGSTPRDGPHRSHTVSALPGTLFIERIDSDVRVREAVAHESLHSWLTEVLHCCCEPIVKSETEFYSPWKGVHRPAYNFLHAVMAFSTIVRFLACQRERLSTPWDLRYLNWKIMLERSILQDIGDDVCAVVEMIRNQNLRDSLMNHYILALRDELK